MSEYDFLLKMIVPSNFGCYKDSEETSPAMDKIFDQLPSNVNTYWGITQFIVERPESNYVAKFPFRGMYLDNDFIKFSKNYSDYSFDLYKKAIKLDIGDIFAATWLRGSTIDGTKIYLQEKVDVYAFSDFRYKYTKEQKERLRTQQCIGHWGTFKEDWLIAAVDTYGENFMIKLFRFLRENKIFDFHPSNYGWRRDGSPVLLDWADFQEGYDD